MFRLLKGILITERKFDILGKKWKRQKHAHKGPMWGVKKIVKRAYTSEGTEDCEERRHVLDLRRASKGGGGELAAVKTKENEAQSTFHQKGGRSKKGRITRIRRMGSMEFS